MCVWRHHTSAYICTPVLFSSLKLVCIKDWRICIWTSSDNSWANRIPLLHLICVMKGFWSGWKDDTNIQREGIAITVICIFVSNRTQSLCNCKRNAYFCSSQASKVYDEKTCWKDQMCGILAVMINKCHVPTTFCYSWLCPHHIMRKYRM